MRVQVRERKLPQARDRPGKTAGKTRIQNQNTLDALQSNLLLWMSSNEDICVPGYTRLSDNPEIQTACLRIAELVATMTIHVLENTDNGDVRILMTMLINEMQAKKAHCHMMVECYLKLILTDVYRMAVLDAPEGIFQAKVQGSALLCFHTPQGFALSNTNTQVQHHPGFADLRCAAQDTQPLGKQTTDGK